MVKWCFTTSPLHCFTFSLFHFVTTPQTAPSIEIDVRLGAADALDPEGLVAGNVRGEVGRRHDDLRVERLLVAVAGAVEVRLEDGTPGAGDRGLHRIGRRAFERRGRE